MLNDSWMKQAACASLPLDVVDRMFFPDNGGQHIYKQAQRICAGCPVQQQCGEFADYLADDFAVVGVWGGTVHREEDRARRAA